MLWQVIRDRKLEGHKFRRQVPLGRYILDFVWLNAKLIVDLDGSQHADNTPDKARDAHF
ncbi:endonuclease domain-containing protein [Rhizobium sullae]